MVDCYNKGEWSEFYAVIKLLSEAKIYAANSKLQKINDKVYYISKIIKDDPGCIKIYDLKEEGIIKIIYYGKDLPDKFIQSSEVKPSIPIIFNKIRDSSGTFSISEATRLNELLSYGAVKASNVKKEDIRISMIDPNVFTEEEIGFSIKSDIGNKPTLLNASGATNFIFNISNIDYQRLSELNNLNKLKVRIRSLKNDETITFMMPADPTFNKNLRKIDSLMPIFLSEMLLCFYSGKTSSVNELVKEICKTHTIKALNFSFDDIKYKISQLLINIALGMVPKKEWDGYIKADGGYIIVKEDGELVCFHIYNISDFGEYLFNNTKFDTPSVSRHKFGKIYKDNQYRIKLNLQIRFK